MPKPHPVLCQKLEILCNHNHRELHLLCLPSKYAQPPLLGMALATVDSSARPPLFLVMALSKEVEVPMKSFHLLETPLMVASPPFGLYQDTLVHPPRTKPSRVRTSGTFDMTLVREEVYEILYRTAVPTMRQFSKNQKICIPTLSRTCVYHNHGRK